MRAGGLALCVTLTLLSGCGSSAHRTTSGADKVQITYDGQIGKGTAPGHAKFSSNGAITDSGAVVINGRDTGPIVYTTLNFTGSKGTFRVSEKIEKGGPHAWTTHVRNGNLRPTTRDGI